MPYPPPGNLPNPEVKPGSPALQMGSLPSEPPGKPINLSRIYLFNKAKAIFGCFLQRLDTLIKKKRKKENPGMHNQKSVEQEVGDMSL